MAARAHGGGPVWIAVAGAALAGGCGRQAIATTDALPLQRVVIYRNGVAYFERAGHVDRDQVRFKMKRSEVGDFLATLAVMERGGSSVRSAAFPLDLGDDKEQTPPRPKSDDDSSGLETVVLSLDGRAHDLSVGYVAESPVWRPSYRLVIRSNGEADLQAWGIVQNLSGEDWKDVRLTLIAGAPLAFEAELGTPIIPQRPHVTDEGEVIASVPRGETSLRQQEQAPAAPSAPEPVVAGDDEGADARGSGGARSRDAGAQKVSPKKGLAIASRVQPPPAPPSPSVGRGGMYGLSDSSIVQSPSPPRSVRSLAAIAVQGGSTRYDLPLAVTIPDKSATMVLLLSKSVAGEALFLFAPDGGVADSSSHPFCVARFTNGAGGTLERGPIAVFEQGAFLGQGMVDPLPAGAIATVPFALERSIAIDQDRKLDELGERVAKIDNGEITVERDSVTQTKYRVRNGGDVAARLLVKHPRIPGARLFSPPVGTEDNVGTGAALVPAKVAAHATEEVVVDERATVRRAVDWFGVIAESAIRGYLSDPKSDRDVVKKLTSAWAARGEIVKKIEERAKLENEYASLSSANEETRRNLRAIEKNKTAEALRQKLTSRLAQAAIRIDDLNRSIVEVDSRLAELRVIFKEAIADIKVVATAPPPTT